jgi:phenylalanyl-tRNA synthetase beta chain
MRVSLDWLKEFVVPGLAPRTLGDRLTMAGLELEALDRIAPGFEGVVVARIVEHAKHPGADKLSVCMVDAGDGKPHQVVCGASNARVGLVAPFARPGARLGIGVVAKERKPLEIKVSNLRGVESQGMLCSSRELGLGEEHEGLLELPEGLKLGRPLEKALALDDHVLELGVTANRGDCLSMLGVAREVAALTGKALCTPKPGKVKATHAGKLPVKVAAALDCPVFAGRLIRGIRPDARSPLWLVERLRRAGLRAIHPVVDVTNYVMLELGQPMHGYDASAIEGGIVVRRAKAGERVVLLDGNAVALDPEVLVIADHARVLGIAGVMGGQGSGVTTATRDVYLEAAWFTPRAVAGRARRFGMHTDAAVRFERGVDPLGQARAIERATALLLEIVGGEPGPLVELRATKHIAKPKPVKLRRARLAALLGIEVPAREVARILGALGFALRTNAEGWLATAPSWRFDAGREEDLIEEVGRIHGYERIAPARSRASVLPLVDAEARTSPARLREAMADRGYAEAISYSFVDPGLQALLLGEGRRPRLRNPIAADMAELRASLLPGLVTALRYNLARQQKRVRIFEYGVRFTPQPNDFKEENVLAALAYGDAMPLQWGVPAQNADFADLKADLEALLAVAGVADRLNLAASEHPALHPGQSALIEIGGQTVGWIGALHPRLLQPLELAKAPVFFEVSTASLLRSLPRGHAPPRFPSVSRDLAVVVKESVTAAALLDTVRHAAGAVLASVEVFDVYRGKGIDSGLKSIAMTLILLDSSRTLTDEDTDSVIRRVAGELASRWGAVLRE